MTGKRAPSLKEKRATAALIDALRTGSVRRTDLHSAAELLSRSLPEASRLPQHALRILTRNAMRQACKAVPPSPEEEVPPDDALKEDAMKLSEAESVPRPDSNRANSNDLLPSIRPRTPTNPASVIRKRRRVSTRILDDDGNGSGMTRSFLVQRPKERLVDVGGISTILENIRELIEWPLVHSNLYDHLGVDPPKGILLHGPPGCGKTLLAHAIAGNCGVSFLRVSGPEIVSGMSGESERKLRNLFSEASQNAPSIVFIDEVDAIASRREGASKDMERRIVSQLLSCIDNLANYSMKKSAPTDIAEAKKNGDGAQEEKEAEQEVNGKDTSIDQAGSGSNSSPVVVIAATNRPESLEPALRRAGRFDREIELGAPDRAAREAILTKLCRNLTLGDDFNAEMLAQRTAGYVGADLHLLTKEAGLACVRRFAPRLESTGSDMQDVEMKDDTQKGENGIVEEYLHVKLEESMNKSLSHEELKKCSIEMTDFMSALETIQPSALREGFATRPEVSWANVGSLEGVREEMMMAIVEPIRHPDMFSSLGLTAPAGVLLYGPPGCGKTLLAKAVASESGANFISVKGPELLSKYVGDSELAVRKVFARARSSAPCVIFFDELDALAPRRGSSGGESSGASERVVNMLLTEMDGFSDRKQVFLIAATNRPDIIDPAMLRPGRLDKLIYVPLPDEKGRASILRTLMRNIKIAKDVDVEEIASNKGCEGFSGADLQAVIRTAGELALKERLAGTLTLSDGEACIGKSHFERALDVVLPSVSERDAKLYHSMQNFLRKTRGLLKEEK